MKMFRYPTVSQLVKYLAGETEAETREKADAVRTASARDGSERDIAVIGMAGRFPGAQNVSEFWHNLCEGKESITFFSDEELLAAGVDAELLHKSNYVKARGILPDIETFDAAFFDYTPREAEQMDPQLRVLHEVAWEALEVRLCVRCVPRLGWPVRRERCQLPMARKHRRVCAGK